jgi:hypothetical protein
MKIGLDFDGVFCNAVKLLDDGAKKLFGINSLPQENILGGTHGCNILTNSQINLLKNFVFEDPDSNLELEPLLDVVSACRFLIGNGHQLQIVTKRNQGVDMAKDFCKKLGLKIPVIGSKFAQPKSSIVNGFDIFLDDSIAVLEELKSAVPNRFIFLWDYNRHNNFPEEKKVSSWLDFVQKIN